MPWYQFVIVAFGITAAHVVVVTHGSGIARHAGLGGEACLDVPPHYAIVHDVVVHVRPAGLAASPADIERPVGDPDGVLQSLLRRWVRAIDITD